jgi:hypothetical protein
MKLKRVFCIVFVSVLSIVMLDMPWTFSWAADPVTLERMERLILEQQKQIEAQAKSHNRFERSTNSSLRLCRRYMTPARLLSLLMTLKDSVDEANSLIR